MNPRKNIDLMAVAMLAAWLALSHAPTPIPPIENRIRLIELYADRAGEHAERLAEHAERVARKAELAARRTELAVERIEGVIERLECLSRVFD